MTLSMAPGYSGAAERPTGRVELDAVVAVVNDDIILGSELQRATERHPMLQEAMSQLPANATADARAQKRRDVEAQVLDELIDLSLMREEARKFEIVVTDEEVDRAMLDVARQHGLTVPELRKQVEGSEQYGSWAEYRAELRDMILSYKVPNYLATWSVSDAQVREHYRKLTRDESAKVEVVQFTFTPASQDPADRDRAFARAQVVGRRLRGGEDPGKLAEAIKYDRELERTVARGDIAPALEDAVFAAQKGSVIGPLGSGQGYVVFKVLEHVESAALSFEEAKDRIREQLESEAFFEAQQNLRRQLRAKAHIDIRL